MRGRFWVSDMGLNYWTREEDRLLDDLAQHATAKQIGEQIGRTENAVRNRAHYLGIDMTKRGEHHWNARIDNLKAAMIGALGDAGFTTMEISRVMKENHSTVSDIVEGRTRR